MLCTHARRAEVNAKNYRRAEEEKLDAKKEKKNAISQSLDAERARKECVASLVQVQGDRDKWKGRYYQLQGALVNEKSLRQEAECATLAAQRSLASVQDNLQEAKEGKSAVGLSQLLGVSPNSMDKVKASSRGYV